MDADVICHPFLWEERQRTREIAPLLGPRAACGTHYPSVSEISPVKKSMFSKGNLIKF